MFVILAHNWWMLLLRGVSTDGSESARAAARSVSERPCPDGTEVKVIGVVNPNERSIYAAAQAMVIEDVEAEGSRGAVSETVKIIDDAGLGVTGEAAVGDARTLIVERAREWGAHLVVVGSHGRRGSERLLLGSVSEYVANQAHCSVEVIRNRAA
jgi:nucleotide-binding universal stress UspA family protein